MLKDSINVVLLHYNIKNTLINDIDGMTQVRVILYEVGKNYLK